MKKHSSSLTMLLHHRYVVISGMLLSIGLMTVILASARATFVFQNDGIVEYGSTFGGIGEQYTLYDYLTSSGMTPVQKWAVLLDNISIYHFNTLRLTFAFADCPVGGGLPPIMDYAIMESVITYVYSRGYRVILDLHNANNMYQYCGSPAWYTNWRNVTSRFKADRRIIGFELFNEPFNFTSANPTWTQTWYPTIKSKTDLVWAFANLTDQIRAIDKDRTVIWADPMSYFQTTSTSILPVGSYRENIAFAWHGWAGAAYYATDYNTTISRATNKINRILWWSQQYPSSKQWLGEFGMYKLYNGILFDYESQRDYCATLINGCIDNGWGFSFWLWSSQHWGTANYTDILLHSNWKWPQIFEDGFESDSFSAWTGTGVLSGETATVLNTMAHHGTHSARFTSDGAGGSEYACCYKAISSSSELYARAYFYASQSGIVDENDRFYFITLRASSDVAYAGWRRIGGVLKWTLVITDGTNKVFAYSAGTPSLNTWYCVELHWKKDSAAGFGELFVNGAAVCSITGKNTATYGSVVQARWGLPGIYYCTSTTAYCDCVEVATTYIGPEP